MRHVFISRFGQENLDLDRRTKHCLPNGFGQEKNVTQGLAKSIRLQLENREDFLVKTRHVFLLP